MFVKRCFAALSSVAFFLFSGSSPAFAAAPECPADVMRSFSALVEKEAETAGYLEEEQVTRLRTQAEEIFSLHPKVSIGEAIRLDNEGGSIYNRYQQSKKETI